VQSTKTILEQLDAVIKDCADVQSRAKYEDLSDLKSAIASESITRMQAAIARLAPPGSPHRDAASDIRKVYGVNNGYAVGLLLGVLRGMRADYAAGYLSSVAELIHADLFADFLEMSDHLLSQGYKDPAAVVTGAVLEEHLRKLCDKNGLATVTGTNPKKADLRMLNSQVRACIRSLIKRASLHGLIFGTRRRTVSTLSIQRSKYRPFKTAFVTL
jgi:hypothetical protein